MFSRLKVWFLGLNLILRWVIGLLSASLMLTLLAFTVKWLGGPTKPGTGTAAAATTASTATAATTASAHSKPSLGAKALKKFDEDRRISKSVTVKKAEGDAALEAIEGVKAEDAAEKAASFEESRLQMAERAVRAVQEELSRAKGEVARIKGQISRTKDWIRTGKYTIGLKKGSNLSDAGRMKLEKLEARHNANISNLEKFELELDTAQAEVDKLQAVLEHPETVVRRYTDAAGKTVIETK